MTSLPLVSTLKSYYIENLKPSSKSAEELRAMGMLDMQTYTQLQAADALRDAAQNPSGGAGLTAGIGAGLGVGSVLSQSLAGMTGAAATGGQPAPSGGTPPGVALANNAAAASSGDDACRSCGIFACSRGRCRGCYHVWRSQG